MGLFVLLSNANIVETINRIEQKVDRIMALVSVEQDVLNTIGTELTNIADAVQTLADDANNPLTAADLTVITDPLSRIENILPPTVEPDTEPEDEP
jgi:archaellum component FlaC